jgi:hypothetical protein
VTRSPAGSQREAPPRDEDELRWRGVCPGALPRLRVECARAAYSLAYRMMGERRAAEDLSQDAFLPIHSHPSSPAAVER